MILDKALAKVFGTKHEREVKKMLPVVAEINELESGLKELSDEQLAAKTPELRERLGKGETLDDILPEAFAVCREAGIRVLGMRHYDVQLIGGMVLHQGRIAEMKTGEGKTLVATLPAYLNALEGKGVHIVTVNDYLARRDSEWMGKVYAFLGLLVGIIVHGLTDAQRQEGYAADITYGTNNEFGFDYLRDNMKFEHASCVQRPHNFSIVDEVDSILVDEARTPLIISGPRRGVDGQILQGQPHHPEARTRRGSRRRRAARPLLYRRLHRRRKTSHSVPHRSRRRQGSSRPSASPTSTIWSTTRSSTAWNRLSRPTRCFSETRTTW